MRIGHLYNLESFKRFIASGQQSGFTDSSAGVILERNLTAIDPKIFEKKYPELTFVNSGIQVDNSGGYARRIQSLRVVEQGDFADAGDSATNKGKISLSAEDSYLKVYPKEAHSIWTDDEVKESQMQNINLPQAYVTAHNTIYTQLVDTIGFVGHQGQDGLLNYGFTSTSATAAIGTATAQELYDDISGLINAQWNAVYNTTEYMANKVTMPSYAFNALASTILNTAAGSSTVLKALRDNFPGVDFNGSPKANDVDGGGSVTAAYSTNPEAMKMRIPLALTIGEIVKINSFDHRVDSKFRIAGLDVLEDTAGYLLTGL